MCLLDVCAGEPPAAVACAPLGERRRPRAHLDDEGPQRGEREARQALRRGDARLRRASGCGRAVLPSGRWAILLVPARHVELVGDALRQLRQREAGVVDDVRARLLQLRRHLWRTPRPGDRRDFKFETPQRRARDPVPPARHQRDGTDLLNGGTHARLLGHGLLVGEPAPARVGAAPHARGILLAQQQVLLVARHRLPRRLHDPHALPVAQLVHRLLHRVGEATVQHHLLRRRRQASWT